jgi:ribosomal protein S18 acetylase RimI-like enzyme
MGDAGRTIDGVIESEPPSRAFAPRRRSDGGRELIDSRGTGIVLGDLSAADRPRIAEILRGATVFSGEEISVALELFDEGCVDCGLRIADGSRSQSAVRNPQSDYLFLGAFTPEEVLVGYACWGPTPATDRTWDLYWIAVDTALQGAGIGTILLDEVERRLARRHARLLIAETSSRSDYAATRGFYQRRGYAEAARVRDFYAPGDDRIIFLKRFHPLADGRGAESR